MKNTLARDIKIAETIVHEGYDPDSISRNNDIALLRLVENVDEMPICLPFASHLKNKTIDDVSLTLVGYGETERGTEN